MVKQIIVTFLHLSGDVYELVEVEARVLHTYCRTATIFMTIVSTVLSTFLPESVDTLDTNAKSRVSTEPSNAPPPPPRSPPLLLLFLLIERTWKGGMVNSAASSSEMYRSTSPRPGLNDTFGVAAGEPVVFRWRVHRRP